MVMLRAATSRDWLQPGGGGEGGGEGGGGEGGGLGGGGDGGGAVQSVPTATYQLSVSGSNLSRLDTSPYPSAHAQPYVPLRLVQTPHGSWQSCVPSAHSSMSLHTKPYPVWLTPYPGTS